jgi:hypothetical protein
MIGNLVGNLINTRDWIIDSLRGLMAGKSLCYARSGTILLFLDMTLFSGSYKLKGLIRKGSGLCSGGSVKGDLIL